MQISVKGKQLDVGDSLRGHVESNLGRSVAKYFNRPIEAQVVFSREAHLLRADISVHAGRGITVQGHGLADDAYIAFDGAAERIVKRLRRHKRRLVDQHHGKARGRDEAVEELQGRAYVLTADGDGGEGAAWETSQGQPAIVAEMPIEIPALTVVEAVMRLDLGEMTAMMFRNRAHGRLNMIYRRPDGAIGWVDPADRPAAETGN
ncbi:MAG: ribosome-associated translation inhibitor RaiA [Alphaproteobacteria bacterium]|nr:ribosome-associated translation inhibitor RaiA [Alphaproteobacteria bacterium]